MIADRAARLLQAKRENLARRLREFLDRNPDVRQKLREFISSTILKRERR
jgi:vacuolar-type H+-ATPase subunit D/Vma8